MLRKSPNGLFPQMMSCFICLLQPWSWRRKRKVRCAWRKSLRLNVFQGALRLLLWFELAPPAPFWVTEKIWPTLDRPKEKGAMPQNWGIYSPATGAN